MRTAKRNLIAYLLLSSLFSIWNEWQAYRYGVIGDAAVLLYGLFVLVMLGICFWGFVSLTVRKEIVPALIYVLIAGSIGFIWAFPHAIEFVKMQARADFFYRYPNLCQSPPVTKNSAHVCYHYTIPREFGPNGPEQWLVFDYGDEMQLPSLAWPEEIKRKFIGNRIKSVPAEVDCAYGFSERLVDRIYWVSNNCEWSRLR